MTNYSRTTLRELKKRYLNILKKCLLANLMAFSFVMPSMAEQLFPGSPTDFLNSLIDPNIITRTTVYSRFVGERAIIVGNDGVVFTYRGDPILDENGNHKLDENGNQLYTYFSQGSVLNNMGFVEFLGGKTTFLSTKSFSATTFARGGAIWNNGQSINENGEIIYGINFQETEFLNNTAISNVDVALGGALWNAGKIYFSKNAQFKNNIADGYKGSNGGAILNAGGTVEFVQAKDDEGNPLTDEAGDPVMVPEYTYGITFKGSTIFTGNKAESESGSALGGAIYNGSYMLLAGENTFDSNQAKKGGAINNIGGKKEGDVIAYGMTLGKSTFMGNTALSHGGAIFNHGSGIIQFNGEAEFDGNSAKSQGGAIYNDGTITFDALATFEGNKSSATGGSSHGGAISNSGSITFGGLATFDGNSATATGGYSYGGAVRNSGGSVVFEDTDSNAEAPVVPNITYGMTFRGDTTFTGNKAEVEKNNSYGGAIANSGYMFLAGENTFDSNQAKYGGAIYNSGGKKEGDVIAYGMTLGKSTFIGNTALSQGGAISNSGYMNFTDETLFEGNISKSETGSAQGGAIINANTLDFKRNVTFQNNKTQGNTYSEGGAIYNTGYMNFKSADFISNSVIADATYARGGAIYNTKDITFSEKVLFSQNSLKGITEAQGAAIRNIGTISFADVVFNGNSSTINSSVYGGTGGAIFNSGKITIQTAEFENNKALGETSFAEGGAIKNLQNGNISILGSAIFKENLVKGLNNAIGGAVDNRGQLIVNNAVFTQNKTQTEAGNTAGGAIYNSGSLELGNVEFSENQSVALNAVAEGGAIKNRGILTFNGFAQFKDNTVEGYTGANGGAIYNESEITFNNGFEFSGNKSIENNKVRQEDINNIKTGTINFAHGLDENGVALVGSLDGGITNNGIINKTGVGTLILGDGMKNLGNGTFTQTAGLTISHADHFLTGTNNITGGELRVHGANMNNLKATVGKNALLTFLSTSTSEIEMKLGENVSVAGDVKFGADESIGTAKYHLIDDVTAKTITIQDSILTAENTAFNGVYVMGENVTLDMQDGDTGDNVGFANLSGESSDLLFDIELKANTGEGLELASDKLSVQTPTAETYKVKVDLAKINVIGEVGDNGLNETYTTKVLEGEAEFETATNELKVFTDVYKYDVTVDDDKQSIKLSSIGAAGENALKEAMDYEGNSAFKFSVVGKEYAFNLDTPITLGSGEKNIVGQGVDTSTIASGDKKMFVIDNENTNFKISDVALSGTGEIIENKVGSVTLEKVTIEAGKVINKDELMIEDSSVHVVENAGTLTATSSELGTVTNAGTLMLDTAEVSELENRGTLTANGSEIGELLNEKDAEVTGGKVTKVTNNGELTVTGATITELVNEHEATITGGELETATNKENGMLSLSAGLRAGTVTNEGELTLDGVTVADLTNSARVKANGSTVQKLVNEQEAELTASTVEDLTNTGKMTAKDLTLKGALKGTGTATLSGKLVADDIFKSENKIISDGMEVSENVKKMELADLEIKEGTTLDIGTREVTAKEVSVGDKATLQVTLNDLDEHGTMKADKIDAGAGAGVHLVLGEKFEGGVFDVFQGTKGAGDLEVKHNNLYNVIEVEEGKYSFMTKDTEALQESLGATKEEVSIADAMTKGTASHERFARMQSEMLIALQSLETDTVAKAKKALTALSGRSTSLYQSQATAGFTQLHNVVSQMLMNTAAPVFGHNGGEEPARASVYIKGLYDRVNSLTGDGFRMRSKGAVLGVQSAVTEDLTIGVGYAGVDTTAKEPLRRTEVKTNTGFISAQYQPNNWWVSGVVSYSRSQYDEEKHVLSSTGKANYDVDSLGAQITTGYNIKKGKVIVTPEVGIRYLNAKQEGYKDSLGTTVQGTNSDFVTAMAGFKVGADLGWVRPLAGVMVGYDVITDDISSVNTLANGATYTINGKALDRLSTTVVAGFGMDIGENATLKLEYNGNYRKEYLDHSGMIRLEMKF